MAEGTGASQTPPQTDSHRQDKSVFGIGVLPRLRRKAAFLRRKKPETQSGILEMFQLQRRQRELPNPLYPGCCAGKDCV